MKPFLVWSAIVLSIGVFSVFLLHSDLKRAPEEKMNLGATSEQRITNLGAHISNLSKHNSFNGVTGWVTEWRECTSVDESFDESHFVSSLNHVHLNRFSDILASM